MQELSNKSKYTAASLSTKGLIQQHAHASRWKGLLHKGIRSSGRLSSLYAQHLVRTKGLTHAEDWIRSYREQQAVDAHGNPHPWLPYPLIDLLSQRIQSDFTVFEYGCGNSTRWWASRVKQIHSCEHDAAWASRIQPLLPPNSTIHVVNISQEGVETYASRIDAWPASFDVVVIDGEMSTRQACARHAVAALKPGGVILWDNSDFAWDRPGMISLIEQGFSVLEMQGMHPINFFPGRAAVFFRQPNVLGLSSVTT